MKIRYVIMLGILLLHITGCIKFKSSPRMINTSDDLKMYDQYMIAKDYDNAKKTLLGILEESEDLENTNNLDLIYAQLAWLYILESDFNQAELYLNLSYDIDPDSEYYYGRSGAFYLFKGEYDNAEEMFKNAMKVNPANCNHLLSLALLNHMQNNTEDTIAYMKKGFAINRTCHVNNLLKPYVEEALN